MYSTAEVSFAQEFAGAAPLMPLPAAEVRARVMEMAGPADEALRGNLSSHVDYILEVSDYVIFSGGKRLRPVLFMLAAQAAGGRPDPGLAAIFEYLHAATLLHDDVIDEAGLRRGQPAAPRVYGNEGVILVGDFLFSKSYSLAACSPDQRMVRALTQCTTVMAEGQVLELLHTDDLDLKPDKYLEIIWAKTAVLLAAACHMGAIHAQAGEDVRRAFYDYGMRLGLAFQMIDDALDYVGTMHEFGKPVGHDLAEGKITLPFIHARDTAQPQERRRLLELAGRARTDQQAQAEAQALVKELGGVEHTMAVAKAEAAAAQAALQPLASAGAALESQLELLSGLAGYVIERRS